MHKYFCIPLKALEDTSLSSFSVGIALSRISSDLAFVYETKDKHSCIKIMKSRITELKRNEANKQFARYSWKFSAARVLFLVARVFFLSKYILAWRRKIYKKI